MSGTEDNWYFDFPSQNGVHYVYKVAPAVKVGQIITMRFAITGNANFVPTEGTATARVRLFRQQRGDTLMAQRLCASQMRHSWTHLRQALLLSRPSHRDFRTRNALSVSSARRMVRRFGLAGEIFGTPMEQHPSRSIATGHRGSCGLSAYLFGYGIQFGGERRFPVRRRDTEHLAQPRKIEP